MKYKSVKVEESIWKRLKVMAAERGLTVSRLLGEIADYGGREIEEVPDGYVILPKSPDEMPDTLMGRAARSLEHHPNCKCSLCR